MVEVKSVKRIPVSRRFPVTVQGLANRIATKSSVDKLETWERQAFENLAVVCGKKAASDDEKQAFYDGMVRLVRQISTGFQKRNPNWYGDDELMQLCFTRVWETIHHYKPESGALSTWVHFVCHSVLCKEYNSSKQYRGKFYFVEEDKNNEESSSSKGLEKFGSFSEDSLLKIRVRDAICELFLKHEDKKDILIECFGNPDSENYQPPFSTPSISEIVRRLKTKYKYGEIYSFYKEEVVPYFMTAFSDYHNRGDE